MFGTKHPVFGAQCIDADVARPIRPFLAPNRPCDVVLNANEGVGGAGRRGRHQGTPPPAERPPAVGLAPVHLNQGAGVAEGLPAEQPGNSSANADQATRKEADLKAHSLDQQPHQHWTEDRTAILRHLEIR